jgi:hypothetical protein
MDKNHPMFRDVEKNNPFFNDLISAVSAASSREQPRAVFLDSDLDMLRMRIETTHEFVNDGRAVVVVPDRLKDIMGYNEALAERLRPEAEKWNGLLVQAAVSEKCNLVITDALKHPDKAVQIAQLLKENNYTVEVRARAVNADLGYAQQRLLYERELQGGLANSRPPMLPREEYDQSKKALAESLSALDQYTDTAKLYNDTGNIYENQRVDGKWKNSTVPGTAYYDEISRPMGVEDLRGYIEVLKGINQLTRKREGVTENTHYTVGSEKDQPIHCEGAKEAAEKFNRMSTADRPYILMVTREETKNFSSRVAYTNDRYEKVIADAYMRRAAGMASGPRDLLDTEKNLFLAQENLRNMRMQATARNNTNKDQAQIHTTATEKIPENRLALEQYPELKRLPAKEMDTLAYLRGLVRETSKNDSRAWQEESLKKFDKMATENPSSLLARFENRSTPTTTTTPTLARKGQDLSL